MPDQLQLYICEHFKADTLAVLSSGKFSDVTVSFFPSRCSRPMKVNMHLSSSSLFNKGKDDDQMFYGCSCMTNTDKAFLHEKNILQLNLTNCFQMFAPQTLINQLLIDGAYIMTPDWLTKWRVWVKNWGDKEQVLKMFSESVSKLVLLDTGIDPKCNDNLKEFSAYINCPSETINIGIDYYSFYLENKILKWRLEQKTNKNYETDAATLNSESDYAMALDLMTNLPRAEKEDIVANRILEILNMLFAAREINYLSIEDSKPVNLWSLPFDAGTSEIKERLSKCAQSIRLTESGKGFCFKISKDDEVLAIIEIEDLVFPENLTKYQNLAIAMAGVLAFSIENSRYFQNVLDVNDSLKKVIATKDKIFSIIAHDLVSPFNVIMGYTNILKKKYSEFSKEEIQDFIYKINTSSESAFELLRNLLIWARSQNRKINLKKENTCLSELVNESIIAYRPASEKKKLRTLNQISEDIIVHVDKDLLKIVIANLYNNAIKFSPENSEIHFNSKLNANEVQLSIRDFGVGIPKETVPKLFNTEENITTRGTAKEKGTGLGLTLCKEFIEKHGGRIWVESEEGVGSQFYFTIPYKTVKDKTPVTKEVALKAKTQLQDLKILIAEDDAAADDLLSIFVKDISKEVIHTKSGARAVELCRNNPDIDLILMDINMPLLNGYEATKQIREFNKDVVIIAQTAYGLQSERENTLVAGCNAYISKPIIKDELLSLIQQYVIK